MRANPFPAGGGGLANGLHNRGRWRRSWLKNEGITYEFQSLRGCAPRVNNVRRGAVGHPLCGKKRRPPRCAPAPVRPCRPRWPGPGRSSTPSCASERSESGLVLGDALGDVRDDGRSRTRSRGAGRDGERRERHRGGRRRGAGRQRDRRRGRSGGSRRAVGCGGGSRLRRRVHARRARRARGRRVTADRARGAAAAVPRRPNAVLTADDPTAVTVPPRPDLDSAAPGPP